MGPLVAAVLVHAPTSSASSTACFTPSGVRRRPTAIRGFCASTRPLAISRPRVASTVTNCGGLYVGTWRSARCLSAFGVSTTSVGAMGGVMASL